MSEQILIIEDETAIQSILSELLTDAGYNVGNLNRYAPLLFLCRVSSKAGQYQPV